jgi:hypothetical protein
MMGRPRLEGEWPRVNGEGLARLHGQLNRLQEAVWAAAAAGDETAQACSAASVETVLERVIKQFEARALARKEKAAGHRGA